ncbi:unnamed protein product [Menidia menidia]|uniref:(Atlantic silverside) hypothetical protein n=1 Tax=Menidia menidia TaxID=238744 RepID=A0A8S4BTJ1_9TELE|nr:unnamed protein product [Menidia menidia]
MDLHAALFLPTVAGDRPLCVEWSRAGSVSDLTLYGSTRTFLAPRLILTAPLGALDFSEVNVDDTVEMLPKSRRALTIQEIAALARSSLHGISQVVKDHVTKPTAMAQGRVAHLIEWKGWCKPMDTSVALESDFNSYSDLSEGEQEARFAAGSAGGSVKGRLTNAAGSGVRCVGDTYYTSADVGQFEPHDIVVMAYSQNVVIQAQKVLEDGNVSDTFTHKSLFPEDMDPLTVRATLDPDGTLLVSVRRRAALGGPEPLGEAHL